MLVIVASQHDIVAQTLADRWQTHAASLLTPNDLSEPGWHFEPGHAADSVAVVSGQRVAARNIQGILTRLPWIGPDELAGIRRIDRDYVAAEMNAFLLAWLAALDCPVLNPPSTACLAGPAWQPAWWLHAAAKAGMSIVPAQVGTMASALSADFLTAATATVIGDRCLGDLHPSLIETALGLARTTDTPLLRVHFDAPTAAAHLVSADPWPDIGQPAVADALLDHFLAIASPTESAP